MTAQAGEDVLLAQIFATIGVEIRYAVEFGARDGVHLSNTHALRAQGWTCLLLDSHPTSALVQRAFLTAENITDVFRRYQVPARFDLLSIDVDGMDFYLWKALTGYTPRVVVIEYNSSFGPDESVVIPYSPLYRWDKTSYFGASAAALVKLGREKGYTLAGYTLGFNLVFVEDSAQVAAVPVPPAHPCGHRASGRIRLWEDY